MGDFYEMFFDDAEIAAKQLGITLTKRGSKDGLDVPMCGVPVHSVDGYLAKLIRAVVIGWRFASKPKIHKNKNSAAARAR